ncbi:hypothetical protein C8R43DRAFT_1116534 [Mycena crocata]|nr:hypothetical protein C8R43DRAFT_1116534 [Mycena crocata]
MSFSLDFAFEFPLPKSISRIDARPADRVPRPYFGPGTNLDEESTEDIFADLYRSLQPPRSTGPLDPQLPPFIPPDFSEDDASDDYPAPPPSRTVRDVSEPRYYTPESGLERDEESDEDSDYDSDDERCAAECAAILDAKDSVPVGPMVPRVVLPLPRRVSPEASPAPASRRSTRRSSSPASSDYSPTPNPRKRKPASKAKPPRRAAKKAAVASSTSPDHPVALPVVPVAAGPVGPPPPNHTAVSPNYWYLLDLGCTPYVAPDGAQGMLCNFKDTPESPPCPRVVTCSLVVMGRHMLTHEPAPLECEGCPVTFAREDSLKRHYKQLQEKGNYAAHMSKERKAFLVEFRQRPEVIQRQEKFQQEWEQDFGNPAHRTKCGKDLKALFNRLWAKA